jgi:hypothetical protein
MNKNIVNLKEQLHSYDEKYPRNSVKEVLVVCNEDKAMDMAISLQLFHDFEDHKTFSFELAGRLVKVLPSYAPTETRVDLFINLKLTL